MEALAAVSLAGNVVQFLDFSLTVIRHGHSLKRSADGHLKENAELSEVVLHLEKLLQQLDGAGDEQLQPLLDNCRHVGEELQNALAKVARRQDRGAWSSYRAALSAVWNKNTLEDMEDRLKRLRDEIGFHLQVSIRRAIDDLAERFKAIESHLNSNAINSSGSDTSAMAELIQLRDKAQTAGDTIITAWTDASTTITALKGYLAEFRILCEEMKTLKRTTNNISNAVAVCDADTFLQTLQFRHMEDREEIISDAYARTFQWLLLDPDKTENSTDTISSYLKERNEVRESLNEKLRSLGLQKDPIEEMMPLETSDNCSGRALQRFLANEGGLFWIWGKPGSGKSTLMKAALAKSKMRTRLKALLSQWSSGRKLLIASFYFYRAGTDMQKSQLGLLHTILYQILSQDQTLICQAFPAKQQVDATIRMQKQNGDDCPVWTTLELSRALRNIQKDARYAFYLHIDGIDELQGPAGETAEMTAKRTAEMLKDISRGTNIKMLVAGRWTQDFEYSFGLERSLNLHESTELDIVYYAVNHLSSKAMKKILLTAEQFRKVLAEIVSAAEGVFIWVKIVVESLLSGSTRFENFDQLFSRLKEYPKDLDRLYWFLFENIEKRYSCHAAFWLLGVYEMQQWNPAKIEGINAVNLLEMRNAEMFDPWDIKSFSRMFDQHCSRESQEISMMMRMRAQCPHFFDFQPKKRPQQIIFAHRTLLDFLSQETINQSLKNRIPKVQNSLESMTAGKLAVALQSMKQESYESIRYSIGKVKDLLVWYWGNFSNISATNSLWNQLIHSIKSSNYLDTIMPANLLSPGLHYWYFESFWSMIARLSSSQALLSNIFIPLVSATEDVVNQLSNTQLWGKEQRESVMITLIVPDFSSDEGYRFKPIRSFELPDGLTRSSMEILFDRLFPDGIEPESVIWHRLLESVRMAAPILRHRWKELKASVDEEPGKYLNYRDLRWQFHSRVALLLSKGANPNSLCRSVPTDPDKSFQSALSVFIQLEKLVRSVGPTMDFYREDRDLMSTQINDAIRDLTEAGATEQVMPAVEEENSDAVIIRCVFGASQDTKVSLAELYKCNHWTNLKPLPHVPTH